MLDPHEKFIFDGIINQLRDEDPQFLRKADRLSRPRRKIRLALAVVLWTIAPVCVVLGGWTGLLMAVVAAGYGIRLVTKRGDQGVQPAWGSSSNRRPGAPSV